MKRPMLFVLTATAIAPLLLKLSNPALRLRRRLHRLGVRFSPALLATIIVAGASAISACGEGQDDGGESSIPPVHTFETDDYHALTFSPGEDGAILFGHHGGVQMSTDGGTTWTAVVDQSGWDAMNLAYDPFSAETLYAAGHDIFYRSDDAGQTWTEVSSDLPGLDLHAFAASSAEQGRLYAFAVGQGLYVSEGGDSTWRPLWPEAPRSTFAILPLTDGTLFVAGADAGLMRSDDGGVTWQASQSGIEAEAVFMIRGAAGGESLYAGTTEGLFVSADRGSSWSATSLNVQALVVGVNPADPLELAVIDSTGNLYVSRDGGLTW